MLTVVAMALLLAGMAQVALACDVSRPVARVVDRWRDAGLGGDIPPVLVAAAATMVGLLLIMLFGRTAVIPAAVGVLALPRPVAHGLRERRTRLLEAQLPDVLEALGNAVRVGQALPQALARVSAASPPPLGPALRHAAERMRLGESVVAALRGAPVVSHEWRVLIAGVEAVAAVGGNVGRLFDSSADLLRRREQVRQRLRTATAQGRMQMAILALLPLGFLWLLRMADPALFRTLTASFMGWVILVGALILEGTALWWARRVLAIEP